MTEDEADELKLFMQCESSDKPLSSLNLFGVVVCVLVVVVGSIRSARLELSLVGLVTMIGTSRVLDLQIK